MNKKHTTPTLGRGLSLTGGILLILAVIALAVIFRPAATPAAAAPGTAVEAAVSIQEAADLRSQGAFVLDVRQPEEWIAGHIPGATLIPLGELPNRLQEIPDDQSVLVVCRSGNRSAQAAAILRQAGFAQATSMNGGMNQWAAAGYEVVTGP